MTRQLDRTWLATVTLMGSAVNSGYVMFDVEDQDHHIDRNAGQYWDSQLCFTNRNAPTNRFTSTMSLGSKLHSYDGTMIAPGFQRAPDRVLALAIVREDFTKYPQNFDDLFWIWSYETKGGAGRGSDADWSQVSHELEDAITKYGTTNNGFFIQILGFVAPNQARIDPRVMARLRSAIIASPQTFQPSRWQPDGSLHPIRRTKQWDDAVAKNVTFLLSELDLPVAEQIADPATRGASLEAFTNKYADCGNNCSELAPAYGFGVRAYAEAGDLEGAKRMTEEWIAWDPQNPDPYATLAKAYLSADKRLTQALALTNRAAELYHLYLKTPARGSNDHRIRSQMFFEVAPYATHEGKIELLRGKIESAMGDWAATVKDLQVAADDLARNEHLSEERLDADMALGEAQEHMGNMDAALSAYLRAASGPYQRDSGAHDHYVRLYVFDGKGTRQQAEHSLLLAAQELRSKEENNYVPVELHQPLPKLQLIEMNGKTFRLDSRRRPLVVDLWATWCAACALELPSLLAFQNSHPEVDVLAVDVADKPEAVTQFLTTKRLTGLHVALSRAFPDDMPQNYPTTFVVSQEHELAFLHESVPNDIEAELDADLAELNSH